VAYLFDTDAVSEVLRPKPLHRYVHIESRVLPAVTVLAYDLEVARVYGAMQAHLEDAGLRLADADLQIAATAIQHNLELVTGNLRHFRRVPGLRVCTALSEARTSRA